jgi:hypothetical protein
LKWWLGISGLASRHRCAEEINEFRSGLTRVYESLQGEATLQSLEGWLGLRVSIDGAGRLAVAGKVKDKPGPGNELSFQIIGLDQSYLLPIIGALEMAEEFYPIVGR